MTKKIYVVAAGVPVVNGQPVPVNRRVQLTDYEALFDLSLDRIVLLKKETPALPVED